MSEMIGKMSVQAKIAELETRIVRLEERERLVMGRYSQQTVRASSASFGDHWDNMWKEFHLMMKEVFR